MGADAIYRERLASANPSASGESMMAGADPAATLLPGAPSAPAPGVSLPHLLAPSLAPIPNVTMVFCIAEGKKGFTKQMKRADAKVLCLAGMCAQHALGKGSH